MSKSETMWVAFPNGGILPKDITKSEERKVGPHEPVRVPLAYGKHLIEDRFAYEAEEPKKAKVERGGGSKLDIAKLESAVSQAELDLTNAVDEAGRQTAEQALNAAKDELAKAQG